MAKLNMDDGSLDYSDDPYAAPAPPLRAGTRYDAFGNPIPDSSPDNTTQSTTPPTFPAPPKSGTGFTPDPGKGSPPPAGAPPLSSNQPVPWQYWSQSPTGGDLTDPAFAAQYVAYWANQPGTNPSLKSDPNYWIQQLTSGHLGTDRNYIISRFKQAEGPPEGGTTTTTQPNSIQAALGQPTPGPAPGTPGNNPQLSDYLSQLLSGQQDYNSTIAAQRQSILDRINGLFSQYSQPVTADDPTIKAQTDAYHGTTARSLQDFKEQAAERANAEGVPSGAFDASVGNATNQAGQSEAGFQAQLMQTELQNRRAALAGTINQSAGLLSSQDQADIQSKMAAIDAALGNQGQAVTSSLGSQSLDLQKLLGLLGLGNQQTSISNQNNQFYDQFAYNQANNGQSQDDLLLQWLLQNG